MPTRYSLVVNNKSLNKGMFCLYVTVPRGNKNLYSLAWRTALANPNTVFRFDWNMDFSFTWSETGVLKPGGSFFPVQMIHTNPNDTEKNAISLGYKQDRYSFENTIKKTRQGNMAVHISSDVPHDKTSVGIAIDGKPALITQASPNISYVFQPNFTYWIAFGDYTEGEILDLDSDMVQWSTPSYQIEYPSNVVERHLLLDERNMWVDMGGPLSK